MYYIKWKDWKIWPYEAIMKSSWEKNWEILDIFYDNATIDLKWEKNSYSIWYKKSKSLFWKTIQYLDLIDEESFETFSFQISNIFLLKIIDNDIKIIAKLWNELKFFENFWRKVINIESDWDKKDLTPLSYFDIFVIYDDKYFYPLFLNWKNNLYDIDKFFDYYWFKSYTDNSWINHFFMLIEDKSSNEKEEIWYFVDNFNKISEKLYFDDYVKIWNLDEDWDIIIKTTNKDKYYIEVGKDIKIKKWEKIKKEKNKKTFLFSRVYEDTDSPYIVWQNEKWFFIISKLDTKIKEENIIYYKEFLWFNKTYKLYIVETLEWEIVLLNSFARNFLITDLSINDKIQEIKLSDNNKILSLKIETENTFRDYIIL